MNMCASKENFDCQQTILQSYDCEHCIFKTHLRVAFYNHLRRCHVNLPKFSGLARPKSDFSLKWYSCKICKQFTTCSALHLLKHEIGCRKDCDSGFKILNCSHCSYKTRRKDVLRKHIMAQHLWFKCDLCDYKGKMKTYLVRHIALHHRNNVPWIYCNFCDHKTKTMNAFKNHMKRRHPQCEKFDCQKATLENYECNFCNFKIHLRIVFYYHMSLCHDTLPKIRKNYIVKSYDCKKCNQFTTSSVLHNLKHDVECLDGRINNTQNQSFVKNTATKNDKWYKCSQCSYKGKKKDYLAHVTVCPNNSVEWIRCDICDFKTMHQILLDQHFNSKHVAGESVVMFRCMYCDWKTSLKHELGRHIQSKHTAPEKDLKGYNCKYCGFKAKSRYKMGKHFVTVHKVVS